MKVESKLTIRKSGGKGYDSFYIYIPAKFAKDSSFPFSQDDTLIIELKGDSLNIRKREIFSDIIEEFGVENATLPKLIEIKAKEFGKRKFIIQNDEYITFNQVHFKSNKIANGLLKICDDLKDCKIALLFPNCLDYITTWFGIVKTGNIFVPINQFLRGNALKYVLENSDTEVLIIDNKYYEYYLSIRDELPNVKKVIIRNPSKNVILNEKILDFEEIISKDKSTPDVPISYRDTMQIIYTEGSTGTPKGVVYKHQKIFAGLLVANEYRKHIKFNKMYYPIPLYYYNAQIVTFIQALFIGSTIVFPEYFNPKNFWEDVKKYNCNLIAYHAAIIQGLMKQPPKEIDRNHTARWGIGGEAPRELWEEFENRFGVTLFEGSSSTEGIGFFLNSLGSKGGKLGSIGLPIDTFRVKIVDDNNNELPPGPENIGEIAIKSSLPIIFEYYKTPTSSFMEKKEDGYIYTKDMGYKDNDGYFYYIGRKSDMVRDGDLYLPIHQIENIAKKHPYVLDCSVIGVPNKKNNETELKIFIIPKKGKLTYAEISEYLNENIAFYLVPRYIEFKERIRDFAGRIRKFKFREEWQLPEIRQKTWDSTTNSLGI